MDRPLDLTVECRNGSESESRTHRLTVDQRPICLWTQSWMRICGQNPRTDVDTIFRDPHDSKICQMFLNNWSLNFWTGSGAVVWFLLGMLNELRLINV